MRGWMGQKTQVPRLLREHPEAAWGLTPHPQLPVDKLVALVWKCGLPAALPAR